MKFLKIVIFQMYYRLENTDYTRFKTTIPLIKKNKQTNKENQQVTKC